MINSLVKTAVAVLVLLAALTACSEQQREPVPTDAVPGTEIEVVDNRFDPPALSLQQGDTVTWTWRGASLHNVVGGQFESDLQTSGTFSHTFDTPGEYRYVCQLHRGMEGVIVVKASDRS